MENYVTKLKRSLNLSFLVTKFTFTFIANIETKLSIDHILKQKQLPDNCNRKLQRDLRSSSRSTT